MFHSLESYWQNRLNFSEPVPTKPSSYLDLPNLTNKELDKHHDNEFDEIKALHLSRRDWLVSIIDDDGRGDSVELYDDEDGNEDTSIPFDNSTST